MKGLLFIAGLIAWTLCACGGGSSSRRVQDQGGQEAGEDAVSPGDVVPEAGTDVTEIFHDQGGTDVKDVQVADEAVSVPEPSEGIVEVLEAEIVKDTGQPPEPICPCDEGIVAEVCGDDGSLIGKTFKNDTCAKCAICKDDPATCPGCSGTRACGPDPEDKETGWILYKAPCGQCGKACSKDAKCKDCLDMPEGCDFDLPAARVCATDPSTNKSVTMDDVCALIQARGCVVSDWKWCEWKKAIISYGECVAPSCPGCEPAMDDPVCFRDGTWKKTFASFCAATKCGDPDHPNALFDHPGACLEDCPPCAATVVDPVCGADTTTYANKCAAEQCGKTTVLWSGPCCPNCETKPKEPVCTTDGMLLDNKCYATCLGKETCPETGSPVCGVDGQTYANDCLATCHAGGILHLGACKGVCEQCEKTLSPVCETKTGYSYQNACFAQCLGAKETVPGLCQDTCVAVCGTLDKPKDSDGPHCADGITFPSSCFPKKCFKKASEPVPGACP